MGKIKEVTYQLIEDENKDNINVNDYVMLFQDIANNKRGFTYKKKK